MKNMKFKVNDEQHSKEIQDALFAMGYVWNGSKEYYATKAISLFADISGTITYDDSGSNYFDKHTYKEHVVFGGVIYSLDEMAGVGTPPIGLRPKFICDALRKKEVLEAIARYVEADKKVPAEWLDEFVELNGRMK